MTSATRGQTSLPALAVALLLLTVVAGLALVMADGAIASGQRDAGERRVAVSLAERLVSPDASFTKRANVLNRTRVEDVDATTVRSEFPVVGDRDFVVRLNGSVVAASGTPSDATTIRRIVLVKRSQRRTVEPDLSGRPVATLPRRTERVTVTVDPPAGTTVWTVRANDRVVLRNASGLDGTFDVQLSRFETTALRFEAAGPLPAGSVRLAYAPAESTKATLAVTVDG